MHDLPALLEHFAALDAADAWTLRLHYPRLAERYFQVSMNGPWTFFFDELH